MCGSADEYEAFADVMPQRTAEELKEELESIRRQYDALPASAFRWRQAVVGTSDRIFPPANQLRAWAGTTDVTQTEAAHYSRSLFENLLTNRQITNVHG
ncbi:biotin synthesis protein BioG [Bacteroides pyogenes DSM 20611 = JCM 6294]|nr:biotin synthesis protein BioG [Bacteroides pyogenes DSM 20611 = JCM 6294]